MKTKDFELAVKKLLLGRIDNPADLNSAKRKFAKQTGLAFPPNVVLLKAYHDLVLNKSVKPSRKLENLLKKKAIRSLSGVAVVSVLTKPYKCPGQCLYCPSQKGMPKSYLSNEPAVMRAVFNKFDPLKQVRMRLKSLKATGHPIDKIELIVIGGTWSYLPEKYQNWFIKRCFDAANGKTSKNLFQAQKINEKTKCRIVGITIETRPDFITEKEIKRLRELGATRVEMGVQNIYDDVLKLNRRGHGRKEVIEATKLLKDAGFKICYHMMPNLPGSTLKRDEKMFEKIFQNPDFQPDLLKIYPCAILKEAPIYNLWKQGKYKPYTERQLITLLKNAKKKIPYYCRVQRLTRDIPSPSIVIGPAKISNMRQILAKEAKEEGWKCKCIRCREVGEDYRPKEKLFLSRQEYEASGGKEIFLSFENKTRTRLYALLRLRIPSVCRERVSAAAETRSLIIFPALRDAAIIRELHTYGQLHPLANRLARRSQTPVVSPQHKGLGRKLMKEAERIAKKEYGFKKMAVISGIGAREYYRKLEYTLKNTYLVKNIWK